MLSIFREMRNGSKENDNDEYHEVKDGRQRDPYMLDERRARMLCPIGRFVISHRVHSQLKYASIER